MQHPNNDACPYVVPPPLTPLPKRAHGWGNGKKKESLILRDREHTHTHTQYSLKYLAGIHHSPPPRPRSPPPPKKKIPLPKTKKNAHHFQLNSNATPPPPASSFFASLFASCVCLLLLPLCAFFFRARVPACEQGSFPVHAHTHTPHPAVPRGSLSLLPPPPLEGERGGAVVGVPRRGRCVLRLPAHPSHSHTPHPHPTPLFECLVLFLLFFTPFLSTPLVPHPLSPPLHSLGVS